MEEKDKGKKRLNIFVYFFIMILVFLLILILQQYISALFSDTITYLKFGEDALFEIIWAGLVLVVLLLFKNKYVFTQERTTFAKGFKYILPEVILSGIFFLLLGVRVLISGSVSIFVIANLLIWCIFIGIVEEFLCRGWLLNEFLERYGDSKKGIILSIILSALIFGGVHFINVSETQGLIDTVFQVINATTAGVFLALVYYKTKNIWLVVFSHALWDFSVMIAQTTVVTECYVNGTPSTAIVVADILQSVICALGYLFLCYWLYRQTDLYEGNKDKKMGYLVAIGIVLYISAFFVIPTPEDYDKYMVCPEYEYKAFDKEYNNIYSLMSEYRINFVRVHTDEFEEATFNYVLTSNGVTGEVEFKNLSTDKKIALSEDYEDYLLIENANDFIIMIQTSDTTVLYGRYPNTIVSNEDDFLTLIKNGLKEYHVPEIDVLLITQFENNDYSYATISTEYEGNMLFDKDDKLYFAE